MADPVTIGAGMKLGEKFFESVTMIASKFPNADQRIKKDVQDKFEKMTAFKRHLHDYAKSYEGRYPDVLLGIADDYNHAKTDYENSIILFAVEITGGAREGN